MSRGWAEVWRRNNCNNRSREDWADYSEDCLAKRRSLNFVALALALTIASAARADDLRVGLIGLDTSHVTAFAEMLNDPKNPEHVAGARIVAGFPGGSPDISSSIDRVPQYVATLKDKWGVEIVNSIPELLKRVD